MVPTKSLLTFLFLLHLKDKERMEWGTWLFIYIRPLFSFIFSLFNLKALLWHLLNIHVTLCIDKFLDRKEIILCLKHISFFARQQMKKPRKALSLPLYHPPSPIQ